MILIMQHVIFKHLETLPHRSLSVAHGDMVVDKDDPITTLYVVRSGNVHLVRVREDGALVILQRAGAGAIMAEASVFSNVYHCAAIAVQESVLMAYPVKAVRALLEARPEAALAYARYLADEVRDARQRAEILALKTVSARLEAWLTWNHGLLPGKGAWHHVADEIGISKEALYRELSKRRKQEG